VSALFLSCSTAIEVQKAPVGVHVKGIEIYLEGKLYAELLFVNGNQTWCRGFAIHYLPTNSYEWISPGGGLQLQDRQSGIVYSDVPSVVKLWDNPWPPYMVMKNNKPIGGDDWVKGGGASDIIISDDGSIIGYVERTGIDFFGGTRKTYRIVFR
jgi:hypothetical protein